MASFTDRWSSGPPFRDIDPRNWDEFELDVDAKEILAIAEMNLRHTFAEVARDKGLSVDRIAHIHLRMFEGVFPDFAGLLRGEGADRYPVDIYFDQYSGVAFAEIDDALADFDLLLSRLDGQLLECLRTQSDVEVRNTAIEVAALTHCEVVRIHPFINGNGRTARMCISYILARAGLPPTPFEIDRSTYYAAVSQWLDHRNTGEFEDLLRHVLPV